MVRWKFTKFHVWNYKSVFLWTLYHSSMSWKITLLYILAETVYNLDKRSPSKCKNVRMSTARVKILPILYFGRLLLLKVYKISAKNYRGVVSHDTEELCKIWRRTGLYFGKWHGEFSKFLPEHSKVWKLGLWCDPFVQSK